ncbi:MAG: putative membrane protein [Cognaticolwellia sp.]|jgi:putative membrane protein
MYTNRKFPLSGMIKWTRIDIYKFLIIGIIPVFMYKGLGFYWLHLPWLPIGVVGTAVAFIVSFKNNASYDRLWEARKIYGGIVNGSRSFTLMLNDFISNTHTKNPLTEEELFEIKKEMIMRHVAWMTSLRHALRQHKPWEVSKLDKYNQKHMLKMEVREWKYSLEEELDGYITESEKKEILSKKNKQAACLNLQSRHLKKLMDDGLIENFRHMEMQRMLTEFFTLQGKVERIKNFPYPRQFATLNYLFVWIFIILLPLGMMHEFNEIGLSVVAEIQAHMKVHSSPIHGVVEFVGTYFIWFTVPFSVIVSWIFHTMERIGETTENPFEGDLNDVPITTMSRGIEIDIRQMIDDQPELIPSPIESQFGIQF